MKLRARILGPFVSILLLIAGASYFVAWHFQREATQDALESDMAHSEKAVASQITRESNYLISLGRSILGQPAFITAMKERNRDLLYQLGEPIFLAWQQRSGVTHWYFHTPDAVTLLRLHMPDKYGDSVRRQSMRIAQATGKPGVAVELGLTGEWVLRVVMPWRVNDQLIGYLELGVDMERIYRSTVRPSFGTSNLVLLDKEHIPSREIWDERRRKLDLSPYGWDTLPKQVVAIETGESIDLQVLREVLATAKSEFQISSNGRVFSGHQRPILDPGSGHRIGTEIFLAVPTSQQLRLKKEILTLAGIEIMLLVVAIASLYGYVGEVQRRVDSEEMRLQRAVDEKTRELMSHQEHLEELVAQRTEELHVALGRLTELNEKLAQRVSEELAKNREKDHLLIQQSRLAAMGEMINNIAHQWRQPLNALGLVVQNSLLDYKEATLDAAAMERYTTKAQALIRQMSNTIDDFRNFFSPSKEKQPFSLSNAIEKVNNILGASLKSHDILLEVELGGREGIEAYGYANEFSQVILNVVNNAKEAILSQKLTSGRIWLSLSEHDRMAVLCVRDNGGGIPEDVLSSIFDPYFTTKEKGTGIGLYMSKMIIENMGGRIEARNIAGGAEFVISIPEIADVDLGARETVPVRDGFQGGTINGVSNGGDKNGATKLT